MADLQRRALARRVAAGLGLGSDASPVLNVCGGSSNVGAALYAALHPNPTDPAVPQGARWCCEGTGYWDGELARCTCWTPVYDEDQVSPCLPVDLAAVQARDGLCADCAFRPGSPERTDEYAREELYALADRGRPFWCHDGMRRPDRWVHPLGMTVSGDSDNWTPPTLNGVPFRADGRPAMLCAGWAKRAAAAGVRYG